MTATEYKLIEALLKQWEDAAKQCKNMQREHGNAYADGHYVSREAALRSCVLEFRELLEEFSSNLTMDDTMARLSKFLDREENKLIMAKKVQEKCSMDPLTAMKIFPS